MSTVWTGTLDTWILLGVQVLAAGTVLPAVAWGVTRMLAGASAATRHLVWALACGALAVWPVLEVGLPVWEAGPPIPRAAAEAPPAVVRTPAPVATPPSQRAALESRGRHAFRASSGPDARTPLAIAATRGEGLSSARPPQSGPAPALVSPIGPWVLALWAFGAALVLGSLGLSVTARRLLYLRGEGTADEASWDELLTHARRTMGVRRPIRLVESSRALVPATWGMWRPVVVVPADARSWPAWQRRAVLMHELAHVRRADHLTQTLAWVAVAVHWFNPLVWRARKALCAEAERACDDAVIRAGERPSRYADGLVRVAQALRGTRRALPPGVAMARRPELPGRVEAILDDGRHRGEATRVAVLCAAAATVFLTVPLAALAPRGAANQQQPDVDVAAETAQTAPTQRETLSGRAEAGSAAPVEPLDAPTQLVPACLPRAGEGLREVSTSRNGTMSARWDLRHCTAQVRLSGDVRFTDTEDDVAELSPDGLLELRQEDAAGERELRIRPGDSGGLDYRYRVDGETVTMDADGRAWMAAMIPALHRVLGWDAERRMGRILARGGPDAVLEEVRAIESDHVSTLYLRHLLASGRLSNEQTVELFRSAADGIESDYELAELLIDVWRPGLPAETRSAYLTAARTIESDHELGRVLETFLETDGVGADGAAILDIAVSMESDYELTRVLRAVLSQVTVDPVLQDAFVRAAGTVQSDHERTELLVELAEAAGPEVLDSGLYLRLVRDFESDYELGRALSALLVHGRLSDPGLADLVELSARMGSDYERAELLLRLIEEQAPLSEGVSDRIVSSATEIGSEYERDRVLSALVRAHR